MAIAKSIRQQKNMPSLNVMVTSASLVAFCLLLAWLFSSSSEEQLHLEVSDTAKYSNSVPIEETRIPEDSPGDKVEEKKENRSPSEPTNLNLDEKNPPIFDEIPNPLIKEESNEEHSRSGKTKGFQKDEEYMSPEITHSEIQVENKEMAADWDTQSSESKEEKEAINLNKVDLIPKVEPINSDELYGPSRGEIKSIVSNISNKIDSKPPNGNSGMNGEEYKWELCNIDVATDFIPCLDNKKAIQTLPSTKHYEHRERHCPKEPPTCLVSLPQGYRSPIRWPQSRNEIWYNNVPHPGLVSYKKDQNWVKRSGEKFIFPGGGTQFKHGAGHYIDFIQKVLPDIGWGKRTRVILDVGCGVASFGGYLIERDVVAMSFAPKDEHEAQVQLALERGIPAILAVMGTQRLPFPSNVYDVVHCARCRVPWHIEGGKLLLELNRVLRPGGYFVWSATPVYWNGEEDVSIWKAMSNLTLSMCWNLLARSRDTQTKIGVAIFQKPSSNSCYEEREKNEPPICDGNDNPNAAWYIPMTTCLHKVPSEGGIRTIEWPQRLETPSNWLKNAEGLYGKPAFEDFQSDTEHWQRVVTRSYNNDIGIDWSKARNVMDMRAGYGGFAAALLKKPVWVINVVPTDAPDTLQIIFDRGLLGIYHDWCESFSTYPRTYDLLHADHLFSKLKKRCNILYTIVEMDRILRPEGWAIFRDKIEVISELETIGKSLHWGVIRNYSEGKEGILVVKKKFWRPES